MGASLSTVSATYMVLYLCCQASSISDKNLYSQIFCVCGFAGVDVITPLKDVNVLEGTKAVLECKVSVPDVTSVKWYLNDEQIKPDDRVHAIVKGTKQRLVINRTHASDEGPYKLVVGRVETSCDLSVESKNSSISLNIVLSILFSQCNSNQVTIIFFPQKLKLSEVFVTLPVQRPKMWSWKLNCPTQELMSCGILRTRKSNPVLNIKLKLMGKYIS